jgi:transcriptional regulator with XRE-family HTH domain
MFKSKRLVKARKEMGYTRSDLIFALDKVGLRISNPTLSRWERGLSSPTAVQLGSLAQFFKLNVGYFFVNQHNKTSDVEGAIV